MSSRLTREYFLTMVACITVVFFFPLIWFGRLPFLKKKREKSRMIIFENFIIKI